jgi:hypothetical protein
MVEKQTQTITIDDVEYTRRPTDRSAKGYD